MEFNKKEIEALEEKLMNPSRKVICPRCGSEIKNEQLGTAAIAKCSTEGCIKMTIRGI